MMEERDERAEEFQRAMEEAPDPWDLEKGPEPTAYKKPSFKIYSEMQKYMAATHIGQTPRTTVDDILGKIEAEGRGDIRNVLLPYPQLNRSVGGGFALRTLTAICASPGVSKSLFTINILLHAMSNGFRARYLPLEDSAEIWIRKFLAARLCDWRILAQPSTDDPEERRRVADYKLRAIEENREFVESLRECVCENPRIVSDPATGDVRADVHYEDVLAFVEGEAEYADVIAVDPVSQIDFSPDGRDFVGQATFMQRLTGLVARKPVHIILVVHTGKQTSGGDTTSALGGSAKFSQLAHNVLVMQRHDPSVEDEVYGAWTRTIEHKLTVTVTKSRTGFSGQKFAFDLIDSGPCFEEHGMIKLNALKRKAGQ